MQRCKNFINKNSKLTDLKNEDYQTLDLEPQQSKLSLKFFVTLNVPYVASCPCDIDKYMSIFIYMLSTNTPMHRSSLYVDVVPRVVVNSLP